MSKNEVFKSDSGNPQALIKEFFELNTYFTSEEKQTIETAWNLLINKCQDKSRLSGEPYYLHPLRVAHILSQNHLDKDSIISALLHIYQELGISADYIKEKFGESVHKIILTADKILNLPLNSKRLHQADAIRKMFFAMSDDVRVILITLADRLDRIRNLKNFDHDYQKIIAEAGVEIWAPLAERMGMQTEKNEFEDLSLKYTNPAVFQQIKAIVAQKQEERSQYLENAVNAIKSKAAAMGIHIEIQSRAKHFYSIYQKMRKRNKEVHELYDLLALRVLCNTPAECYTLIGVVHGLWKPLDGRFKDYIAMPKANGYQSLHTTVMCQDKPLEIQIRTHQMHNQAEHGIASHWLYKKGTNKDYIQQDQLGIINKLQELKNNDITDEETFINLKNELLGDQIYVFTPRGDVIQLPCGATALDFAYAIHSAIGEKVIAAKADGKIIPLNRPLENTQIIEVITNPNSHPTEAQLKLVKTSKAHQKIHSWLMLHDPTFSENIALQAKAPEAETSEAQQNMRQKRKRPKAGAHPDQPVHIHKKVLIDGQKNVLHTFAQCCKPEYPDLIVGYVTITKGIKIHRADCLVYHRNSMKDSRTINVQWDD
ncbi:MAG: RelA/SpoT family protein [Treponema sp.]|nr:RelA/SpoT family protein [Treponema sp.]